MNSKMLKICRVALLTILAFPFPMNAEKFDAVARVVPIGVGTGTAFSWVTHGSAYRIVSAQGSNWGILYRGVDGRLALVSDNPEEVGRMIRAEIGSGKDVVSFLNGKLHLVLYSILAPEYSDIVDDVYLRERERFPESAWDDARDSDANAKALGILKKHLSPPVAEIGNHKWKRVIYIVLRNGSVERWEVEGGLSPFSITRLERIEVEKVGTVIPLPSIG